MMLGILQARMGSRRLPGKVLADLGGVPMLVRQIERIRRSRRLDRLVLATSTDAADDPLAEVAADIDLPVYRGAVDDVLDRVRGAAERGGATNVVRLTGDCPLTDPAVIDACIALHQSGDHDYTSNVHPPTWPDGLDVEVCTRAALEQAWQEAREQAEREHVTPFLHQRPERFCLANLTADQDYSAWRWTVDEPEDLAFVRAVYAALHAQVPDFGMADVLDLLHREPELCSINQHHLRNAGMDTGKAP